MNIEAKLNELKAQADTARQQNLRAEVAAESALNDRNAALEELQSNFKVNSVEEAKELLQKLKDKLDSTLSQAKNLLEDFE